MHRIKTSLALFISLSAPLSTACSPDTAGPQGDAGWPFGDGDGAPPDSGLSDAPFHESGAKDRVADEHPVTPGGRFCDLPGSVQFPEDGGVKVVVPGGTGSEILDFLTLRPGFCAHYFGTVGNTRQLRFAPGGELFVASPTTLTTGGGGGGKSAIVIFPDDDGDGIGDLDSDIDGDGVGDAPITFLSGLPSTQGMLFADNGYFYYQDGTRIMRRPYAAGDRAPTDPSEQVADITFYSSSLHWPKAIDQADDGTIYVGNGGDQGETCYPDHPFHGGVLALDGSPQGAQIAKGFRNPIAIRCQRGHDLCFAAELAQDYTDGEGGREKLVPIRRGDDWGFPCCLTTNAPAPNQAGTDCSGVTPEDVSFIIGDTPFSFDFEPGKWPAPYTGSVFVPLHGAAGSWKGARVVAVAIDPATGLPMRGTNLPDQPPGAMTDFATGWDDGSRQHGRPAAITFAPDGRMFVGNDNDGVIFWVAPLDLER